MRMEINLLPHRQARRVADLRETLAVLVLGLVVVIGGIFFVDQSAKSELEAAEMKVAQLKADIERYKPQQQLVNEFKPQDLATMAWAFVTVSRLDLLCFAVVASVVELHAG